MVGVQPFDGGARRDSGSSEFFVGVLIGENRAMSTVFILKGCQRLAGG